MKGPLWLGLPEEEWPQHQSKMEEVLESAEIITQNQITVQTDFNVEKSPTAILELKNTVLRVTAWVNRFIHNTQNKVVKKQGELSTEEICAAERYWIKTIQEQNFKITQFENGHF